MKYRRFIIFQDGSTRDEVLNINLNHLSIIYGNCSIETCLKFVNACNLLGLSHREEHGITYIYTLLRE